MVIPSVNHYSMNVGKRFWPSDNTDINRMFQGYNLGETTQRIAAGLFEAVKGYEYGIQLASFYIPGDFVAHVRMMDTGYQNASLANLLTNLALKRINDFCQHITYLYLLTGIFAAKENKLWKTSFIRCIWMS